MGLALHRIAIGHSDCHIWIDVCQQEIARWFSVRFGSAVGERDRCAGLYAIHPGSPGGLLASGPDGFSMAGTRIEDIAEPLVQHFLEKLAFSSSQGLAFHAAGVSLAGRGAVLSGRSGSGKSTLTCACLKNGFDYLSDEVVSLKSSPLQMSGFPRPINLKAGSKFVIDQWLRPGTRVDSMWKGISWVDPAGLGSGKILDTTTPVAFVFPRYVPESEVQAKRLSPADSLMRLLTLYVNRTALPRSGFDQAAELARSLPCWELQFSNPIAASESLADLLAQAG